MSTIKELAKRNRERLVEKIYSLKNVKGQTDDGDENGFMYAGYCDAIDDVIALIRKEGGE